MEHTTCLKQSKDVEFQDVYYTVKERKNYIKVTGHRHLLRGVSGSFRNGQLSAIMGPSGAGKSSLLNALSGYRTSGVEGFIKMKRKYSCYITQEDNHQPLLSVKELMNLSCNLKLKNRRKNAELITNILENLHLNHRRNITASNLSGGERKRLSIALELVANPNIFFLDEPTSGLDEVTAAQCIRLLLELAKQGRTIVCTIHQPSARTFNYFDHVYVLAKGQCVYQGSPNAVIPYLRLMQLECPKHYSPSDYIIEVCDTEDGQNIPKLSKLVENGKLLYRPQQLQIESLEEQHRIKPQEFSQAVKTFFNEQNINDGAFHNFFNVGAVSTDGSLLGGATALFGHMKTVTKRMYSNSDYYEISGFRQFCVLLKMMLKNILRARIALVIQLVHHLVCGLFFGLIFLKLGNQGERMFDHLKFCIGTILAIVYTQVMVPILSYPGDVKLVKKETFNRWYALTPYYAALTVSRIPLQVVLNLLFLSLTYWMAGLPEQWWRFALFATVGLMTSFVAEGMGLAIGATFNITNGCAVGPLVIAPFLGLAIYGFDFAPQIPDFMNFIMKFSYIRVAVVALVLTVFGFNREELDCNDIYCHFGDPKVLIKFLDVEKVSIAHQFFFLTLLLIFFRTILFLSLRKRLCT